MEKLFKELAWKCHKNKLDFRVHQIVRDDTLILEVLTFDEDFYPIHISKGYTAGWHTEFESPIAALERMHREVDEFINE